MVFTILKLAIEGLHDESYSKFICCSYCQKFQENGQKCFEKSSKPKIYHLLQNGSHRQTVANIFKVFSAFNSQICELVLLKSWLRNSNFHNNNLAAKSQFHFYLLTSYLNQYLAFQNCLKLVRVGMQNPPDGGLTPCFPLCKCIH